MTFEEYVDMRFNEDPLDYPLNFEQENPVIFLEYLKEHKPKDVKPYLAFEYCKNIRSSKDAIKVLIDSNNKDFLYRYLKQIKWRPDILKKLIEIEPLFSLVSGFPNSEELEKKLLHENMNLIANVNDI